MLVLRYLLEEMKNKNVLDCFLRPSISILKTGNDRKYGVAFWLYFLKGPFVSPGMTAWKDSWPELLANLYKP